MAYKSVRLLVEAIHSEMDLLRKSVMACEIPPEKSVDIYDAMGTLRGLFDELGVMADRPTLEDVVKQSPMDYVATMKPLVGNYHRQLMVADQLTACLCEDLQATGTLLVLIGDGKIIIRTSHHPDNPEVGIVVEAMVEALDSGMKQFAAEAAAEVEKQAGIEPPPEGGPRDEWVSDPYAILDKVGLEGGDPRMRQALQDKMDGKLPNAGDKLRALLPEIGMDPLPPDPKPLRVKYCDLIQEQDLDRNRVAELVIDMNDIVVKDRNGAVGRQATQEELDSCITVMEPGMEDEGTRG